MYSLSILLSILPLSLAVLNGPCSIDGTPGVCITTTDCASDDGSFRSGFCPNDPDNVRCCIKPECGSGGNCRPSSTCTGTAKTGLCPGPADFKCCEPSSGGGGTTTPPPPPPPPSGGGGSTGDLSLSANGVAFIAAFESYEANFYIDAAGVRTIGYGHACQTPSDCNTITAPISEPEAKALLNSDANEFEACVNRDVTVAMTQNQFDALVSFGFNLGCGPVAAIASNLNAGDPAGATARMKLYVNANGRPLAGLIRRRNEEVALFNKP